MNNAEQLVAYAMSHETSWARDCQDSTWGVHHGDPAPYNRLLGPVSGHGGPSGGVWRRGQAVVTWGDVQRPELTFSVAKTYLALLAGVAFDSGLIKDLHQAISQVLPGIGFDTAQNRTITWMHLLQQTSEWEGSLFGLPDQVDHFRHVSFQPHPPGGVKGTLRQRGVPGSFWEYNDVRINQLSLALLHLFRRPLPEVFRDRIMAPLGASSTWNWLPYDNAWVDIDGQSMPSVPGGTHWGGGVTISSADQALVGQMMLNQGRASHLPGAVQVLSARWIELMGQPCALAPFYGLLVWLNQDGSVFPSASRSSYYAIGAGTSITAIDPENQTVTVARWIDSDAVNGLLELARSV